MTVPYKKKLPKTKIKKLIKTENYSLKEIADMYNTDVKNIIQIAQEIWKRKEDIVTRIEIKNKYIKPLIKNKKIYFHDKTQIININRKLIKKLNIKLIEENQFFFIININKKKMEVEKDSVFFIILEKFFKYFNESEFNAYFRAFYKEYNLNSDFKNKIKNNKIKKDEILQQISYHNHHF